MFEITGKNGTAKVFAADVDEVSMQQIYALMSHPMSEDSKVRFMPDLHAGMGCVIGTTMTLTGKIIPGVVGVDIGCGVLAIRLGKIDIDYEALDKFIRKYVPSGMKVRDVISPHFNRDTPLNSFIMNVCGMQDQDYDRVLRSIGTLGGGNHFIEIDEAEDGTKWLTIHSGSRNFGLKVANFHQKIAKGIHARQDKLDYLEGQEAKNYLADMNTAQMYADANRAVMGDHIVNDFFGFKYADMEDLEIVESVHNYISFTDNIVRKGAISARKGQRVVIPWNMRDGVIIGTGKGNEDFNCSAPHGLGRNFSRTKAKATFSMKEFKETMKDVWTSCVHKSTLDESPMAYKDHKLIEKLIADTVEIQMRLKSLYNFKAS